MYVDEAEFTRSCPKCGEKSLFVYKEQSDGQVELTCDCVSCNQTFYYGVVEEDQWYEYVITKQARWLKPIESEKDA